MFALLLLAAAHGVVADDQAQFESFWTENQQIIAEVKVPKRAAWMLYEWTQAQFSLGFCSQYVPADVAEEIRHIPDEDGKLKNTAFGRWMVEEGGASFRGGMAFRGEVKPTEPLCTAELKGRGEALRAGVPVTIGEPSR